MARFAADVLTPERVAISAFDKPGSSTLRRLLMQVPDSL